jgi:radical SAM protein with 4Fe4S-binding SPASM domain
MDNLRELLDDPEQRHRLACHISGEEQASLLRSLKVKLISTCNLRCGMCRYWRIPRRSLPLDVVRAVLDSAAGLGCRKVHLSGGEVTLYEPLPAVIRHAARLGMRVNLTTNGVLVDKERARSWLDGELHGASFSIDGARAETHDAIRGVAGAFKQTVKGIRVLRREILRRVSRTRIRINTVLQRDNLHELPDLHRLAAELGAVDVVPMPVDGTDVPRPTREQIIAYNTEIAPEIHRLRQRYGMSLDEQKVYPFGRTEAELTEAVAGRHALGYYEHHLCYAPYLHSFVGHTGNVYACCMTSERMPSLGNVLEQSLADIFRSPAYEAFRRSMRSRRLPMCAHCDQYLEENSLVSTRLGPMALPVEPMRRVYPLSVLHQAPME